MLRDLVWLLPKIVAESSAWSAESSSSVLRKLVALSLSWMLLFSASWALVMSSRDLVSRESRGVKAGVTFWRGSLSRLRLFNRPLRHELYWWRVLSLLNTPVVITSLTAWAGKSLKSLLNDSSLMVIDVEHMINIRINFALFSHIVNRSEIARSSKKLRNWPMIEFWIIETNSDSLQ